MGKKRVADNFWTISDRQRRSFALRGPHTGAPPPKPHSNEHPPDRSVSATTAPVVEALFVCYGWFRINPEIDGK